MTNPILTPIRRSIRRVAVAALAFVAAALSPAFADKAAEDFVAEILVEANAVFAATDEQAREAGVERLVDKYVDMDRVARFALGQYARVASDEQMAVYTPLFRKYATSVYQSTLDEYAGQQLTVDGSIDRSPKDVIVNTRVVGAKSGDPYADLVVHWRVYRKAPDAEPKVIDAGAQGVWLAIEQQSQFKSVIANNGGGARGIDALIAGLQSQFGE
ncbi:MAG: ABC transporter substrate-binding protein [Parvularculaceae bacterium]